jgi:mono/diheme cytochrome c family protein
MPDPAQARSRAPVLGPDGEPLPTDFVFAYLADPQPRRDDIGRTRMPDFGLLDDERAALALYLGVGAPGADLSAALQQSPEVDANTGAAVFAALGCAGCHAHAAHEPGRTGPDLSQEGARVRGAWLETYLSDPTAVRGDGHPRNPGARMPDFRLADDEAAALHLFITGLGRPGAWTPDELTPFQMQRTERLVEERLACLGCHTLDGEGGRIAPAFDDIAARLQPAFVLDMVTDPQRTVPGGGMPRQHLESRDARRVASYLLQRSSALQSQAGSDGMTYASLADTTHPAYVSTPPEGASAPEALYRRNCAACHGVNGRGDGFNARLMPVPPSVHASAELMARRGDDALFDGIHAGAWVLDGSGRMPPFGELLTADEIRSLVVYIRELCDCQGPDWSRDGAGR